MRGARHKFLIAVVALTTPAPADEPLYRYEGDVLPYDESAGWGNGLCEDPCTESIESGHFVLRWPFAGDTVNYQFQIATPDTPPPPSTLWVEWRFRSNHPVGPTFSGCDAGFKVQYGGMFEVVQMYGDAAFSFGGGTSIRGLNLDEFHTYRFESLDGVNYRIAVDGQVFIVDADNHPNGYHAIAMQGRGGCIGDQIPNMVNEWDFVRYGTISFGERIVGSDPPSGSLDPQEHADLDRFTVTFRVANYVFIDDITVETIGAEAPVVVATRRRENDEPDTVEIVLDRPIPMGATTRFTFDDGVRVNVIEYAFASGDANGDGQVDLADFAAFQNCFELPSPSGACLALDLIPDNTIDLVDYAELETILAGP